ncbi:MAG: alpha/beta hydrolase [Candidatus Tumulicola sp.]
MIETIRLNASGGAVTGARCLGDRGPAVVFVHGVGSTASIWDPQLEALANSYRCLAIELRGNGAIHPDPDPALISRAGFADDVLAVAEARDVDRFVLVGCSLGGVVAFELWKRTPRRLSGMVIADSFAHYPDGQAYADSVSATVLQAGDMRAFAELRAAKLGLPPERRRVTIDQMACKSVPCYLASTQATWTGDYRDVLPGIDVPVEVVWGEHDAVAPRPLSEEIVRGIPDATFAAIDGAGHVSNADAPEAFNTLLRAFLPRV